MDFDISVEVSRLYVSFFNRAADPEGLQYWVQRYNDEVAAGRDGKMFLEDMADSFAQSPEAKAIYETTASPTDAEIKAYISEAYMNMFGRTPDDEGLDYWAGRWKTEMDQGKPGVRVLFEIENAARNSTNQNDVDALKNKAEVAAKFTNDFVASGAEWKSEDMASAKSIVDKVDHTPASVQSANDEIAKFIEEKTNPDGGQEPGGGDPDGGNGGGPVVPEVRAAATIANGVISIGANTEVTMAENNGVLTISRPGFFTVAFNAGSVVEINVAAGATVNVASTGSFAKFGGDGLVSVKGVAITEATASSPINYASYVEAVYKAGHDNQGNKTGVDVLVNGSEGDTIKALWDIWDDIYTATPGAYNNLDINTATIELGLRYVAYLNNGGTPFTDFSAKVSAGRDQSLHDNLLGNLNIASMTDRGFSQAELDDFSARIPNDILNRPWVGGYSGPRTDAEEAARAVDYARGWNRPDYVTTAVDAALDGTAREGVTMWNGSGINAMSGFTITTHEGAGIELALRARGRDAADSVVLKDASAGIYHAKGGLFDRPDPQTDLAKWNIDLSVTSGLNGSNLKLSDFNVYLLVDINPKVAHDTIRLKLSDLDQNGTFESFVLDTQFGNFVDPGGMTPRGFFDNVGGEIGNVDTATDTIAQNSQNFNFAWIQQLFDANSPTGWDLTNGDFTVELIAEHKGVQIASTDITIIVGDSNQLPGASIIA